MLLYCSHWISCSVHSSDVLLKLAILSFILSQLFEKWFQYIPNISVQVHGFVVRHWTDDVPSTYSTPHHTPLQSLCHVAESCELHGDFHHSSFMCSENLHSRLSESMLRLLWTAAEDLWAHCAHFQHPVTKPNPFKRTSRFKLIHNYNSIWTKLY
jgi:hypothetical protein